MYSVVLSLALASGTESPDVFLRCRFFTPPIPVAFYPWWGPIYPYQPWYGYYPNAWGYPWCWPWSCGAFYNPWFAYYPWYYYAPVYSAVPAPAPRVPAIPGRPEAIPKKGGEALPPPLPSKKETSLFNIRIPAGATLLVNGLPAPPTGLEKDGVKTFRTPNLPPGSIQSYAFAIVGNENGEMVGLGKIVEFRVGDTVTVDMTTTVAGVTVNPAR